MLYNPHTRPCSLASIQAYIDTKDPKERYSWVNPQDCACGQYLSDVCDLAIGRYHWGRFSDDPNIAVLNQLAMPPDGSSWGTWGDLRARVILRKDLFV